MVHAAQDEDDKPGRVGFSRLMALNRPELVYAVAGAAACALLALQMPGASKYDLWKGGSAGMHLICMAPTGAPCWHRRGVQCHCRGRFCASGSSLAMAGVIQVYYEPTPDEIRAGGTKYALINVGIGLGSWVMSALQGWCFAVMGCKLSNRVRLTLMRSILNQVGVTTPPWRAPAAC